MTNHDDGQIWEDGPGWEDDLRVMNVSPVSLAKQAEVEAAEVHARMCELFADSGWTCPTVNGLDRGYATKDLDAVREHKSAGGPVSYTYAGAFQEAVRTRVSQLEHHNAACAWNDAAYEGNPESGSPPYATAGFVYLRMLAREVCKLAGIQPGDTGRSLFDAYHPHSPLVVRLAPPEPFLL